MGETGRLRARRDFSSSEMADRIARIYQTVAPPDVGAAARRAGSDRLMEGA
jgi:hypothetical protein